MSAYNGIADSLLNSQQELRYRIQRIRSDATLGSYERIRRIQRLVSGIGSGGGSICSNEIPKKNSVEMEVEKKDDDVVGMDICSDCKPSGTVRERERGRQSYPTEQETEIEVSAKESEKHVMVQPRPRKKTSLISKTPNCAKECKHYLKELSRMHFACCDTIDPCHRCHTERGCELSNPPQLLSVICNACDVKQAPSSACINPNCLISFSTNHCDICMIWTQSDIFHCHGCGLCRVGKSDTLFHCETCEACFHISTKETHYCTKISMKHQRCPLCLEDTHFSQKRCVVMRCGHVGHFDCLQEAWTHESGNIPQCPTCRKSLLSAQSMQVYWDTIRLSIEMQPLSESEVKGVVISCNDCEQRCVTPFHYLGLECQHCRGFNTTRM